MSLNPLNELKRRLEDITLPLPKRLCLAKNIVTSHHFPTAPKERIISEWLEDLSKENKLTSVDLQQVLSWLAVDDLTSDLKGKLIQVVSQYIQTNNIQNNDMQCIVSFLDNTKISTQLCQQIDNYLTITITLLKYLKTSDNTVLSQKLLNNFSKYYKESKKKLEFITKFLQGENLETVFGYLDTDCHDTAINVCQNILFPMYKRTFFISYLQTLIRKDNIEELVAEKGDNIQSVLKIMSTFFEFPNHRTEMDPKFLQNFVDVFVSCFRNESQIVFAFYIMVTNVLAIKQEYIIPSMNIKPIIFDENDDKIKRNLFLNMLKVILKNEIDIGVRLTDTFGEKISKVEIKKNFLSFLQVVMMGQLKLKGKLDKATLLIIKIALKLDPILIEQKMLEILPPIMASKKNSNIAESYTDMLNCLLEILFKLSRGTQFLNQMLPLVKSALEASNTEQLKIEQEITENNETSIEKLKSKLITGSDVFPQECVESFGKFTTDLMFRQNRELLEVLLKDFEVHCLATLEEGVVRPSIRILTEMMSAILCSFFRHNKMSDHTVPQNIAEDFWNVYTRFEDCLKKFGLCVLKIDNCASLLQSFLNICLAYSQLKLLNIKYSNYKITTPKIDSTEVFDLTLILPCLSSEEWVELAGKVENEEAVLVLDNLLVVKTMAIKLLSVDKEPETNCALSETKSHLIKQLSSNPNILAQSDQYIPRVLFMNLDSNQYKNLAKVLVKLYLNDHVMEMFSDVAISNNRSLLNALVLETAKNMSKCLENCDSLTKALNKSDFDMAVFRNTVNIQDFFNGITTAENNDEKIKKCIEIFKLLRIPYLEEKYQLTAIFVLLVVKKNCQSKKIRKNIDLILQNIFELSQHVPDLYQVFPMPFIFSFKDTTLIDLLTLKIKTSNQLLIIKCLVEKAVKRVKTDSDLVKNIVNLLLSTKQNENNSIETFSDPAFQITCMILPLIVKQKKAITLSAFRSILADLQEKLHKILLETFKNVNFTDNSSLFIKSGSTEDSVVESEGNIAALNAIAAYTLTLSKYCETTDIKEIQNLDCLWSGLEFFVQNAVQSIANADSKPQHVESSIQLLNVALRHIKKLDAHPIFNEKDKLFNQIWKSFVSRLGILFQKGGSGKNCGYMEDLGVTLKFVCELVSIEGFDCFVGDLAKLVVLKRPMEIIKDETKSDLTNHLVSKHLWTHCLRANTIGPKCGAMTKIMFQNTRNLKSWIRQHYDSVHNVTSKKKRKLEVYNEENKVKIVKVNDDICDLLRIELDTLAEVILAGKKITLDYKFLDSIFELQHMIHYILGFNTMDLKCEITWHSFFTLYEGSVAILNSLLVSREELLEDRWPSYMQCYRALASILCERATSHVQLERNVEEKLAEIAHSIEKLTQAISKRKKQVSRIAAYTVADICTCLEKNAPSRMVRQHLENSVAALIQASDSSYAMAFLKRALAGSVGQMTMSNLYTMYKRYHKYTGNS